jgi:hypothetical protein
MFYKIATKSVDPLSKLEWRDIQSTDNGADFSVEWGV